MISHTLAPNLIAPRARASTRLLASSEPADLMLWAIVGHMMVSTAHLNAMFPILLPFRPAILTIVVAGGLYCVSPVGARSLAHLFRQPATLLIVALLAWSMFTIPSALHRGIAYALVMDNFIKTVLMFVLVVAIVRGPQDLSRIAAFYFLGTVLYAIYAQRNAGILLDGEWRLGKMGLGGYDSNDFAVFCVSGLPLAIHFVRQPGRAWLRPVALFGLYFLGAGIVSSGSRGGFLASIATGIFILFRYRSVSWLWRASSVAAAVLVFSITASDQYWTQMQTIGDSEEDYNRSSATGRIETWKRGVGYTLEHPITGVGAGNFPMAEGTLAEELIRLREYGGVRWNTAHSAYVQIMAELGLPGLALFISLIVLAWRNLTLAERSGITPGLDNLVQALKASLVGLLVGIAFLSHAYKPMLYAVLAMAAAAGKVADLSLRVQTNPSPESGTRRQSRNVRSDPSR